MNNIDANLIYDLYPPLLKGFCRFCRRQNTNNPSDFYHDYDCERRFLLDLKDAAIKQIERRLDNLTCGD